MKKAALLCSMLLAGALTFSETNANDTQAAIVNSLLIQQLMQMQQNNQNAQNQQPVQTQEEAKPKKIETESDLLEAGFKRFKIDEDAEDYIVFKNSKKTEYEVELWATNRRNKLSYYGTILVEGKKGYKGNPLDGDLEDYSAVWMKITNQENAIIKNLGEKHSDQYFEIQ